MPCNSDYMEPTQLELDIRSMQDFIDELNSKPSGPINDMTTNYRDQLCRELCNRLTAIDVTKYSLELQMWWRDHQKADAVRVAREIEAEKRQALRRAALAKLTEEERGLLGL